MLHIPVRTLGPSWVCLRWSVALQPMDHRKTDARRISDFTAAQSIHTELLMKCLSWNPCAGLPVKLKAVLTGDRASLKRDNQKQN